MSNQRFSTLHGRYIRETESALLFEVRRVNNVDREPKDFKEFWFPLSQITKIWRVGPKGEEAGALDYIDVATWLLEKKGL